MVTASDSSWVKGCRQVAATRERFQQLCASRTSPVSFPTIAEVEQALQQGVRAYELQHRNWRNHVYRVKLEDGTIVLLKQVSFGTDATVRGQFDELEALGRLQVPGLRVPRPVALLPEKRALIMEFVPGETITALLSSRAGKNQGLRACELAGAILAQVHRAWEEGVYPLPVEQLAEDIATVPWRLSRGQKEMLRRVLAEVAGARVSVGRMHYDYEPDNLLLYGEQLFLVDPSAGSHRGVHLFEVATFHNALRRRLHMRWVRRPSDWRLGLLSQGIDRFDKGYLGQGGAADLEPQLFTLAVRFFELQRLGQIFVSQKAKIDMARQIGKFGWEAGGPSINRAQFGLLDVYKRWLFHQLARELPG
jgi:tRNA A-37 threonylcarbamoyl transferase component Bud32